MTDKEHKYYQVFYFCLEKKVSSKTILEYTEYIFEEKKQFLNNLVNKGIFGTKQATTNISNTQ